MLKSHKTNIILIGASGCGKTTIGKTLADLLCFNFIDTDILIESAAGIPITDIFSRLGEDYFRNLESQIIKTAALSVHTVIATGGGCIMKEDNVKALSASGILVYLKCSPEKIYKNIKDDTSRPLMQSNDKLQRIEELLSIRAPLYAGCADIIIDITKLSIKQAADAIHIKTSPTQASPRG